MVVLIFNVIAYLCVEAILQIMYTEHYSKFVWNAPQDGFFLGECHFWQWIAGMNAKYFTGISMMHGVIEDPEAMCSTGIVERMGEGTLTVSSRGESVPDLFEIERVPDLFNGNRHPQPLMEASMYLGDRHFKSRVFTFQPTQNLNMINRTFVKC